MLEFVHFDGWFMCYCVLTMGANNSASDFCQFFYFTRDICCAENVMNWDYIDDSISIADLL